jgi:hypothetical protein
MKRKPKTQTVPSWVRFGTLVDYHSVIDGPVTSRHTISSGPVNLCNAQWVVWLDGKRECVAVEALTLVEEAPWGGPVG